ncbi:MAG: pyruvate:ferredoxin (flavodoxin) oxidoreductase [Alphaproteobacteria bacterium]|nr:pyruvate:ferredoxin (flavodoxin) oxidoreductase [Alphaproteobacteria bacterium]MBL0717654.1 pyruvate:ferredoxin (flavodoxin) oxidoreductase [Alphaproteobacteria bacterium]
MTITQNKTFQISDGSFAVAQIAYLLSDFSYIFPITPSTDMAEAYDGLSSKKTENIFGDTSQVIQMQSEGGAIGALHGALQLGSMATTFTASQGLLLMIPTMFKIMGEQLPCVIHVASRTIATHALSIFGDKSDIMATLQTGFGVIFSNTVQESHHMAFLSNAISLKTRIPFINSMDGWRTSSEISKFYSLSNDTISKLFPWESLNKFRSEANLPENPKLRGSAQNPDIYFQGFEAINSNYNNAVEIIKDTFKEFEDETGFKYNVMEYYGSKSAKNIIVIAGAGVSTIREFLEYTDNPDYGVLSIRILNPWSTEDFINALPNSTENIAVLDHCKSPGMVGEPFFLNVSTSLFKAKKSNIEVVRGRYGLSSKEFTPNCVKAIYDMLTGDKLQDEFTVGINDDITHLSLPLEDFYIENEGVKDILIYGLGSDGSVTAGKNSIKIIGENTDKFVQGYAVYDSKKAGNTTTSHLRFSDREILSEYLIDKADFISCSYFPLIKKQNILTKIKENGIFLINSPYGDKTFNNFTKEVQETIIRKNVSVWAIDATSLAQELKMGAIVSPILQSCMFKLTEVIDYSLAEKSLKDFAKKSFAHRGEAILKSNISAIERSTDKMTKIEIPTEKSDDAKDAISVIYGSIDDYTDNLVRLILEGNGDTLPVSAFLNRGEYITGTTKLEKRTIAPKIPDWDPDICIQCGKCAFVCPHSAIRTSVATESQLEDSPKNYKSIKYKGKDLKDGYQYTVQTSSMDCTGCNLCSVVCPAIDRETGKKALEMVDINSVNVQEEQDKFDFMISLPYVNKEDLNPLIMKHSQLMQPLFEFSGACAGCGETPYLKLITQLFGEHMIVANATGCTSIFGGSLPTTPWSTTNEGKGPAWSNSLFENNAEYGLGMTSIISLFSRRIVNLLEKNKSDINSSLVEEVLKIDQTTPSGKTSFNAKFKDLKVDIDKLPRSRDNDEIKNLINFLREKSMWLVGGDGWAYDIGYGGLDHIIHTSANINTLVLDTQGYSNTGGQASKATPIGATMKFASSGKQVHKKNLGNILLANGEIYVAQIAMLANPAQSIKAIIEAESFNGPSVILAHAPCIEHKYKISEGLGAQHQIDAVSSGEWPLFRFDPRLKGSDKNPMQLDSKSNPDKLKQFLLSEGRFSNTSKADPRKFEELVSKAENKINCDDASINKDE